MVHYGKHIIDPETGLCEICDRGAIHDFRHGKRPARQFLYSNQDGKFTYRPADEEIRPNNYETTPRYVRKPLYPEPTSARTRPLVHEEPVAVQRKVPRQNHSSFDDYQNHSPGRPTTFYYVDNSGQMYPRNEGPPDEPQGRYLTQNHPSPRVVQQRAQTPPPPDSWRSKPKRYTHSETEPIQRSPRIRQNDIYGNQPPDKAEMYHIEQVRNENRYPTLSAIAHEPNDYHNPLSKNYHYKQRHIQPVERKYYPEPEPTVIRKVYKKLPPTNSRYEPAEEEYIPNGRHVRPARKTEKTYPTPRTYKSLPQLTNSYDKNPSTQKNASVYYIQNADDY